MKLSGCIAAAALVAGCAAGAPTRLHTLGTPSGRGEVRFSVENRTGAIVNNLYLAPSEKVKAAGEAAFRPDAPEQRALWGDDLLPGSGLEPNGKLRIPVAAPGRYDVRVRDRDGREQHISGLRLEAGGRYVLELEEGSWRAPR
jgi:hypothetical protein